MSDQPKPPLSVWLDRCADTVQTLGFYALKKESLHVPGNETTYGPYVHLEQFMELVEVRASSFTSLKYGDSVCEALKQIKQELESGE
jgi:uncharacterized membrane protein